VNLNLVFSSQGLRVEIYFGNADADVNQSRFDLAFAKRAEVEKLAGENLGWETLDGKKACRISFYGPKGDVSNKDGWAGYIEWFANTYTTMKKVNGELVIPALKA